MDENTQAYGDIRLQLERRRDELLKLYDSARANLDEQVFDTPGDAGDESTVDLSADYFYRLTTKHQQELADIGDALDRWDRGVYGACQHCEEEIGLERLRRVPVARLCIHCQQAAERDYRAPRAARGI